MVRIPSLLRQSSQNSWVEGAGDFWVRFTYSCMEMNLARSMVAAPATDVAHCPNAARMRNRRRTHDKREGW
jgi:hypothetical protein